MINVFIDGSEGTTGLRIADRLKERSDVKLIEIDPEFRKDSSARAECINKSDVTFLCLPDVAAKEAVGLVTNKRVKIIDASTAHRTADGWTYGLPELSKDKLSEVCAAKRVAVPGSVVLSVFSLTGYSGGGKKMIAEYESKEKSVLLSAPRQYGLNQQHKHLKEMTAVCGLKNSPVFSPIVCDFYSGMEVTVPLDRSLTGGTGAMKLRDFYAEYYKDKKLIKVMPYMDEELAGFVPANLLSGRDDLRIFVGGNEDRITVSAVFDNLGKGASGAAIQNMNLMFGLDETAGLNYCETDFI